MKKTIYISFVIVVIFLLRGNTFGQGILAPGGTGAWGNMVYGGFGLTTPQPYSNKYSSLKKTDMVAAFGVGLGNPVKGLGFQLGSNMLDVSEQDLYNFGVKVHRYFGKGVSAGAGIDNLFTFGSEGAKSDVNYSSEYVAVTKDLQYTMAPGTFLSKISYSVGVGFGRFSKLSDADEAEHNRKNGTYAFGAIQYAVAKRVNLHLDWSGTNLNAGISITSFVESIPFSIILSVADLTPYSGDGPRFLGAFGMAYQFKQEGEDANKDQQIKDMFNSNNEQMLYKINTVKDDLDKQIDELEKQIELLKTNQGRPQTNNADESNSSGTYSDNDKVLNDKVKNYKNDDIVKVNAGDETGYNVDHGYYVIIHSFREKEMAEGAVRQEKGKGVDAQIVYNKTRKWYYIYSYYYKNLKEALVKSSEQRSKGYEGCWVHIY